MKRVRSSALTKVWALSYQEQPRFLANLFRTDLHEPTRKTMRFCSKRFRIWAGTPHQCKRIRKHGEFRQTTHEVKLLKLKYSWAELLSLRSSPHQISVSDHTCKEIANILTRSNADAPKVKLKFVNPRTKQVILVDKDWYWKAVKRPPHLPAEERGAVHVPYRLFRRRFLTPHGLHNPWDRAKSCKKSEEALPMEIFEEVSCPFGSYDSESVQPKGTNWNRPHSPTRQPKKKLRPGSKFWEPPDSRTPS